MLEFIKAGMQYKADKAEYKAKKAWQDYRNTMTNLSNAVSQNAITSNEILSNAAFARQAMQLQKATMATEGSVVSSAAAAGVKGKSVNQVVLSVQRSSAEQERERQIQLETSWMSFDQQRTNSAMSAALQQDYSYIPKPKASTYFINAAIKTAEQVAGAMGGGSMGSGGSSFSMSNFGSSVFGGNSMGQSVGAGYSTSATGPYLNFGSRRLSGYNLN
jgi:hypothetical protein